MSGTIDINAVVEQLKAQLSSNNTRGANSATSTLREALKAQAALPVLIQIVISGSYENDIRQLASIEARKLIDGRWPKLGSEDRATLRNAIFQAVLTEQDERIQHSIAHIIPEIATVDSQWTDLASSVMEAINKPEYCKPALYLVHSLLQAFPKALNDKVVHIASVLETILSDPSTHEPFLRNAIVAYGSLVETVENDSNPELVPILERNIPKILELLMKFINNDDSDTADDVFSVCQALITNNSNIVNANLNLLLSSMITLASQTSLDETYRCRALSCITNAVQYFRTKVQAIGICEPVARLALHLLAELGEDYDGEDEDDESVGHYGYSLFELLLSSYSPQAVISPILNDIGTFITSDKPELQQAGTVALRVCVTCAPDFISTKLSSTLPLLKNLLESPQLSIRKSILTCLISVGELLGDDLATSLVTMVDPVIVVLKSSCEAISQNVQTEDNTSVAKYALSALSQVIPSLEKEARTKYATELMEILVNLVENKQFASIHASAIGALGCIAGSVGDKFVGVLDQVMAYLAPPLEMGLQAQDSDSVNEIYEAVGRIAQAVGSEPFSKYVHPLISSSLTALESSQDNLFNDTIYILWSLLADVYDENITTYLDRMMTALLACVEKHGAASGNLSSLLQSLDPEDLDDSDAEDITFDGSHFLSDQNIELGTAVDVIGDLMLATKAGFMPYFEKTVRLLLDLVDKTVVEYVRQKSISTLWRSFQTFTLIEVDKGTLPAWTSGSAPPTNVPDIIIQIGQQVFNSTRKIWADEIDSDVVEEIHTSIAATLRTCGPTMLMVPVKNSNPVDVIMGQITKVLSKRHMCQDIEGSETEDVKEAIHAECSEYDWSLIDTAFDVICSLASALGAHFAPAFDQVAELVFEYANCNSAQERSTAVGTIAESIKFIGEPANKYVPTLIKLLPAHLAADDYQTVSNSAYCAGIICEKTTAEIPAEFIQGVLASIAPRLVRGGNDRITDNCAGCLARIMSRFPEAVPFDESLTKLVSLLPLPEDHEENGAIYQLICKLYDAQHPTMLSLKPQVIPALQQVLAGKHDVDDAMRAKLETLLGFLQA